MNQEETESDDPGGRRQGSNDRHLDDENLEPLSSSSPTADRDVAGEQEETSTRKIQQQQHQQQSGDQELQERTTTASSSCSETQQQQQQQHQRLLILADHRSTTLDPQPLPGSAYMPPPRRRHSPLPQWRADDATSSSSSSSQQQQQSALRRQAHQLAVAQQQRPALPTANHSDNNGDGTSSDNTGVARNGRFPNHPSSSWRETSLTADRGRATAPLPLLYNAHRTGKSSDPEDTNHYVPEEEDESPLHNDEASVPVSGWSLVEVSNEPGAGIPPSARSLHAATLLNGTMYVFGGFDGATRVNNFFAFSFAGRRWSPVLPAANSGPPPSPRDRHVAVAFGNSIYVHGGFDGTSRVSDFWAFDFSTMTWREVVALQGTPPSARHSHCAAVMNHSLYVACGYDGSYKSDIYQFDFTLSRWTTIRVSGRRPRARYRATLNAVKRPTPSLILHGGHDGTRHLADTHVFDLEKQEWSSLAMDGIPPIPRDSHVAVTHGNSIYVFGGSSGAALNDLHELQLPSSKHQPGRWRPVNTGRGTQPQPRFCHAAVVYQDTLYSFGGYSGSERINEFIKFDFALYDLTFEVPPPTINAELRSMVNNPTLSDVTFVVEGREIHAHKLLLIRCEYFQSLFLGSMMESTLSRIPIEQVRYSVFLSLLEYLYTDHVRIPLSSAMELFEAADLFMIPRLKTICEKRMLQSISVSNAASIFYAADMHSAMALRQKAKKYILSHFEEVSKTSSFEEMGRGNIDLVFELLKSR